MPAPPNSPCRLVVYSDLLSKFYPAILPSRALSFSFSVCVSTAECVSAVERRALPPYTEQYCTDQSVAVGQGDQSWYDEKRFDLLLTSSSTCLKQHTPWILVWMCVSTNTRRQHGRAHGISPLYIIEAHNLFRYVDAFGPSQRSLLEAAEKGSTQGEPP